MIDDEELDALIESRRSKQSSDLQSKSAFQSKMDEAKVNILMTAATEDESFVKEVTNTVKQAAIQSATNEQKTAELDGQKISLESEKIDREQRQTQQLVAEDKWTNLQKRRQFHYDGVKPIMESIGVSQPMNLLLLYTLTIFILPFYMISKLIKGTIGVLLCGAEDGNRSKMAKGFIWTVLSIVVLLVMLAACYLFLKWQGIDILQNLK